MVVIPGYQSFYWKTAYQNFGNAGYLYLQWWTHKIGGLHKNDFSMAARSDEAFTTLEVS
jgi:pterin-4a-carbinolamine dehydratase